MPPSEVTGFKLTKASAFRILKAVVFLSLMINLFVYLYEDVEAYLYLAEDSSFFDVLESFAVTIDYAAWMVLIILFEIETTAHQKERFTPTHKLVLGGLTALCYVVLLYAAWGYVSALHDTHNYDPIDSAAVCDLVPKQFAYMNDEARPIPLTQENCGGFLDEEVHKSPADNLIATTPTVSAIRKLGWIDVFNASAWLLVVLLFQIEVMLEMAGKLSKRRFLAIMGLKIFSYLVLFGCAVYWTIYSAFIDSWDAWLWLLAFVLIDLNLLGLDENQLQNNRQTAAAV